MIVLYKKSKKKNYAMMKWNEWHRYRHRLRK